MQARHACQGEELVDHSSPPQLLRDFKLADVVSIAVFLSPPFTVSPAWLVSRSYGVVTSQTYLQHRSI